jgi:hypothetical protein
VRIDPAVWKLGSCLAALRLVALWSMVIGFRHGDWRQVPGYFLSFVMLPELLIVRQLRNDQPQWIVDLAVLTFFLSYLYAWVLLRLRRSVNR